MKGLRIAQIKNFILYKKPRRNEYYITIGGYAYDNYRSDNVDGAVARFIRIVEEWQGYEFKENAQ